MNEIVTVKQPEPVNITIRNLMKDEIFIMDQIAEIDGRNPGQTDGEFLYTVAEKGFIAAIEGTKVIGTIAAVSYPENLGFIGLHYVVEHHKNSGLWERLLSVALAITGERNVSVNCREENILLYERFGFQTEYKINSYEGVTNGIFNDLPPYINSPHLTPYEKIDNYCRKIFPYDRKLFLNQWINQPKSLLFGKYENKEYKGIGLFKPCRKGYRLAPLMADDPQSASEILTALCSHCAGCTPYYLDIPESNREGINLAKELQLKKIGETIRMFKGKKHEISLNNVYSFTSMEFG